jgi:anaerobic magnesium-protoporphyrin IX monomethyl ester cyclase
MHITLISPYPDITAFGMRTISAHLKRYGYRTRLIFIPDPFGDDLQYGMKRYTDQILDQVTFLCRGSDLVGVTLMTNFFDGAVQVTERIKRDLDVPVIWGGVHPTIRPQESLEYADIVCVGDGEDAVLELMDRMAAGRDWSDIPNLWIKRGDVIVRNPPRPLQSNLDIYPPPDYSLEDHHILFEGIIQPLNTEITKRFLERGTVSRYLKRIGYQTMTGRGCPHQCTYCVNDALKNLYGRTGYLRWRSTGHVIEELLWVKEQMPYIGFIWISDDAFFAHPSAAIMEFCREYKENIGLPFSCLASPLTVTKEKMAALVDAGLIYVQMGIQSGSPRIQELFNRKSMSNDRVMQAVRIINEYKDRMFPPNYDFILDVPYETDQDVVESLRLIAGIPKPYHLQPFALVLYPGTRLYEMAKRDGLVGDEKQKIYAKSYTMREGNYLNLLITLASGGKFPGPLLKLFVSLPVVSILNSKPLKPLFKGIYRVLRAAKRFVRGIAVGQP